MSDRDPCVGVLAYLRTEKTFLMMESLQKLSAKALLRSGVPTKWKERLLDKGLTRCACDYYIALYSTNDTTE